MIIERNVHFRAGEIFPNNNGSRYLVLLTSSHNGDTLVASMTSTPWVCTAHNICRLDNGSYEWSSSTGEGFADSRNGWKQEIARLTGRN